MNPAAVACHTGITSAAAVACRPGGGSMLAAAALRLRTRTLVALRPLSAVPRRHESSDSGAGSSGRVGPAPPSAAAARGPAPTGSPAAGGVAAGAAPDWPSPGPSEEPIGVSVIPRPAGVTDGIWNAADAAAVNAAAADSFAPAKPAAAVPVGGPLLGLSESELCALAVANGQPAYRGTQLHAALYKRHAASLADVAQVPKAFRESLAAKGYVTGRAAIHHVAEAPDGTKKLLLRLADDRVVETVGIPSPYADAPRLTVCVSSQVGCPMRCTFCATGKGGFARNLKPHEIVGQVLAVEQLFGQRVSNIVFMGMGEPLLNLKSVMAAHRCLNEDIGIGARGITISTVGVPNSLRMLAEHSLQSTLAVSLHAPNQALREQLVPSARAYPLSALLEDCRSYFEATGRRVSFEYTLLGGVNDSPANASELAALLHKYRLAGHVNLIPYNWVDESEYKRPSPAAIKAFAAGLKDRGVGCSVRQTRGLEASAACGQLRNAHQKTPLAAVPEVTAAGPEGVAAAPACGP